MAETDRGVANGTGADGEAEGPRPRRPRRSCSRRTTPADLQPRAPIVTVMGHVDHGKTSLLDAIRTTEVAAGERGGITQHIGASEVDHDGKRVVFLDTPGHEAFTAMRARGARVTDIAVIVVAADDGVMPQTLEAIDHAKAAKVPIIIALNKIDKADANPDRVKTELTEAGVVVEEYGGDVPLVPVSARTREGLDELHRDDPARRRPPGAEGQPEAAGRRHDRRGADGQGPRRRSRRRWSRPGTLGSATSSSSARRSARVRALENDTGKRVKKAGPASAVVVLGLAEVPEAGDILRVVADEKEARTMVEQRKADGRREGGDGSGRATLEDLYRQIQAGQAKELRIILKADVSGSLGAITHALEQLDQDEVRINVLHEGAGDITDNDIMLASASDAIVVGFNTKHHRDGAPGGRGRGRRRPPLRHHLQAHRRHRRGAQGPARAGGGGGRRGPRGGPPDLPGRQEHGHRRLRTSPTAGSSAAARASGAAARSSRPTGSSRCGASATTSARSLANYECGIGLANFHDLEEGDIIECFTSQTVSRAPSATRLGRP